MQRNEQEYKMILKISNKIIAKKAFFSVGALLLLAAGLWNVKEIGIRTDRRMRRELIQTVVAIAATIQTDEAQALSFTADDQTLPAFERLSNQFKIYAQATGLQNIYTMALRDGNLVFGPESLPPDAPLASAPGTVYLEPSEEDFQIFENGKSITQGPASDEYGNFVTATAPVFHPTNGEVMLTVGLDIDAASWNKQIRRAQRIPFLLTAILFFVFGWIAILSQPIATTEPRERARHIEPVWCAIIMLLLTALSTAHFYATENASRSESFHSLAQLKAELYKEEFNRLQNNIELMAAFFSSSEFVSGEKFSTFVQMITRDHPIKRYFWLPEIAADQVATFEKKTRANIPNFTVHPLPSSTETNLWTKAFPVLYVEPLANWKKIQGLDLYSDPAFRVAIDESLQSGYATASASVDRKDNPPTPCIYFFHPISTPRQNGVIAFRIWPELLMQRLERRTTGGFSGAAAHLVELEQYKEPHLLMRSENDPSISWETLTTGLHKTIPLFAAGKTYALLITPEAEWLENYPLHNWGIALIAGLILTGLITGLITVLSNRPALLEKLVRQRTAELEQSQKDFKAMADTLPLAIYLSTGLEQTGEYINPAFTKMLGYTLEEFTTVTDGLFLAYPDADYREKIKNEWFKRVQTAIDTHSEIEPIEAVVTCKDGSTKHILWGYKTIGEKNYAYGLNLTERHRAQKKMLAYTQELERFNQASVGRELRMIELKMEINTLCRDLHRPEPYPLQFLHNSTETTVQ